MEFIALQSTNRIGLGALLCATIMATTLLGEETGPRLDSVGIQNARGRFLEDVGGGLFKFRKGAEPDTCWIVTFTKDGLLISKEKGGHFLCIDPKTKRLALCAKPGPTTTWQVISGDDKPARVGNTVRGLLFMKVEDVDLRLSSDEMGLPVLAGNAEILTLSRWSP